MARLSVLAVAWTWILGCALEGVATETVSDQVAARLRSRIVAAGAQQKITVGAERLDATRLLSLFYRRRAYKPAWSDNETLLPAVDALVATALDAESDGLVPADYHLFHIESTLTVIRRQQESTTPLDPDWFADLDLLLTNAFLLYGSHLWAGRVDPTVEDGAWNIKRKTLDPANILQRALETNDVAAALSGLRPSHPAYTRLRRTLAWYRELAAAGGWPLVPSGPTMKKEVSSERISRLRARLRAENDLGPELSTGEELFDGAVEQAVRRFQQRHGLEVDGIVGPATLAALNTPVETRVRQIVLNLERWRWLPRELGPRAVVVNIAGFRLEVVENEETVLTMRIVAGRPMSRTPVFSTTITAVVLNPAWNIPPRIAVREIVPLIRKNPHYLAKHPTTVLQGWGARTKVINPRTIPWSELSGKPFPYRLREEPGPLNPLGRIKFDLPNPFTVYLHDTPAQELFTKAVRAFSHGCIRIEKPLDLAAYVLRGTPQWTPEALLAAIAAGGERIVQAPQPIPIYVGYWTAWVENNGVVHFPHDLYGRDRRLDAAFD
jgi:murein L,D-transpeptidase YcbB/YkuD